jgi:LacI family transcriptional regulator
MSDSNKKINITDVSKAAGVSVGTVSNVLNNTRFVSEEKRQLVLKAASNLGFQLDSTAQTLRRKKTRTIGFCTTYATPAFLSALAETFEDAAEKHGFDMVMAVSHQDPERELSRVKTLLQRKVDGLVLLPTWQPQKSLDLIAGSDVPAVIIERLNEDDRFDYVTVDQNDLMQQIVRQLAERGRKHILFIPQRKDLIVSRQRSAGIEQAIANSGNAIRSSVLERGEDAADFEARFQKALRSSTPPDAIVVGNSSVAIWTLRALKAQGASSDRDISVVTLDDPDWGDLVTPPIGCVRYPVNAIVDNAWDLLEKRMQNVSTGSSKIVVPAEYLSR